MLYCIAFLSIFCPDVQFLNIHFDNTLYYIYNIFYAYYAVIPLQYAFTGTKFSGIFFELCLFY